MRIPCAALVLAAALSTSEERKIALPTTWSPGTTYHVEFTKTREEFEGGELASRNSTRSPIDVEILSKNSGGYVFRWVFGRPVTETSAQISGTLVDKISGLVEGLRMDLVADASGTVTALADPSEMERHFERAGKALLEEIEAKSALEAGKLEALKRSLAALRGAALHESYLQAPKMFTMPSGAALTLGERREYEDLLPNPFGGDPLPSRASIVLSKLDTQAHEAVVDWRQTIDPERAGPILEASLREFAKRTGQELPKDVALSLDAIEDAATYVYDCATGIPKSVVTTRTTSMAGRRRIDSNAFRVSAFVAK